MIAVPIALVVAVLMEYWAGFVHEHAWHGLLWSWHEPHHGKERGITWNDALSASHAPLATALIVAGCHYEGIWAAVALGVGSGMTLFGFAYFVMHDGFVHGRLPLRFLRRVPYFERLRRAHLRHHGGGKAPYGFFAP